MREFELIASVFAPLAKAFPGSLNLKDDAALLRPTAGEEFVLTADALCEGVHFLGGEDAEWIAKKALRCNLSDLAAKGAKPVCYLLTLMLPEGAQESWVQRFARGLGEDQALFHIALAGGDTVASKGPLGVSITALGSVPAGRALLRSGARPGDRVYVSGTLGDAALGLAVLEERLGMGLTHSDSLWLKERYFLPQPRVALGPKLIGLAHAAMDVSDGLVQDLGHICAASGVGAVLHRKLLPLSEAAAHVISTEAGWWKAPLSGGDDYEILFTAPQSMGEEIAALAQSLHLPITAIGEIISSSGVTVLDEHGQDVTPVKGGYSHKL